ncbi:MAG: glycine cleavage T C-terminal barrel domain-containing protein, partial [Thermodesulfobacteriota bacterium]
GYTGEDGFELYLKPEHSEKVWRGLLEAGNTDGILPCGLGARDTLRLEMGYPLYGHELSEEITPIEAGLSKYVATSKEDFIGREPLVRQIKQGVSKNLIGFFMEDDGIPRSGYRILNDGAPVGEVTSGTFSPSMRRAIGMGYVATGYSGAGLAIEIRGKARKVNVVTPPFYAKDKVK